MKKPKCIDLKKRFGTDYRVGREEVAENRSDPWTFMLPGARGVIYPFGGNLLAVEIDGHRGIARRVSQIPGVVLHQDGDHEKTFLFPVELFGQVAALVRPRKRPKFTAEQVAANVERLAKWRFRESREKTAVLAAPSHSEV